MHDDLGNSDLARRLRGLADFGGAAPYDWAEFQRRRRVRAAAAKPLAWHHLAVAASVLLVAAAALALGYYAQSGGTRGGPARRNDPLALARSSRSAADAVREASRNSHFAAAGAPYTPSGPTNRVASNAVQLWYADLPREPVVHRVGTQLAETGLVDQIATLDQLLSAERVANAGPQRLAALERQRAQLVGSLAQFRYAELLAQANR